MKTAFKLLIVVIILNGVIRVGLASLGYYRFREAAQQAVLFGAGAPTLDVREVILERARELQVPVRPDDVLVRRQGGRTWVQASYQHVVEIFPNQAYPMDFSFSVEGYSMVLGPP